jgi:hypothetical protein
MVKNEEARRASMVDAKRKMSIAKAANLQGYASQMKRRASMKVEEADRVLTMDPGSQMAEAVSVVPKCGWMRHVRSLTLLLPHTSFFPIHCALVSSFC